MARDQVVACHLATFCFSIHVTVPQTSRKKEKKSKKIGIAIGYAVRHGALSPTRAGWRESVDSGGAGRQCAAMRCSLHAMQVNAGPGGKEIRDRKPQGVKVQPRNEALTVDGRLVGLWSRELRSRVWRVWWTDVLREVDYRHMGTYRMQGVQRRDRPPPLAGWQSWRRVVGRRYEEGHVK